jgi:hypothetical protein
LIAAGSDADERDGYANPIFDVSQIVDGQIWKILGSPRADGRLSPARE